MKTTALILSTVFAAASATVARSQNVGLVASWSPLPQVGQSVGQPCGPVVCPTPATQPLTPTGGAFVRFSVFGAARRFYALGFSTTLGCQTLPSIQYSLSLGGVPQTLAVGVLPAPTPSLLCGGRVEEATTPITIPAALQPGTTFVVQGLTFEDLGTGVQPAFTNAVRVVIN